MQFAQFLKKTYDFLHRQGRTCLNCESWRSGQSLLCPNCEQKFISTANDGDNLYSKTNRDIDCAALFDWVKDESRCLSLLIKQLKGTHLRRASDFWAEELFLRAVRKRKFTNADKIWVIVPAPPKNFGQRDHAYKLAAALSNLSGWSLHPCLERMSEKASKELSREERSEIEIKSHEKFTQRHHIVFVDDVVTTGCTALSASRALGRDLSFEVWCLGRRRQLAAPASF